MKMHDEKLCSNPNCECHTDESKKVRTPFPIENGNPYCCSNCAVRKEPSENDDLITVDWLLSVGATDSVSDKTPRQGCTKTTSWQGKDWYIIRAHFEGENWYFQFGGDEPTELGVGAYVEMDKEVPHITTKGQFRVLYELLENKKLVE